MDVRPMRASDIPNVQLANLTNLPENYFLKYYLYHALSWPQLSYVAIDTSSTATSTSTSIRHGPYGTHPPYNASNPKIVGYVLAKLDEDNPTVGHITSISVMRTHRRLGLAEKLMRQSNRAMREYYGATACSLHVRCSNEAAISLYTGRLGFAREKVESKYYADGEDAWCMRLEIPAEWGRDWAEEGHDEGGEVGEAGKAEGEKLKKVKVGRGLGVGELVERDERSTTPAAS